MKQITTIFTFLLLLTISASSMKAQTPSKEKELVIAQMNCCINSLTNIVQCNSIQVLDHETDLLLNNLTMTEIIGLEEVAKFRAEMIQRIGDLRITSQERRLMKRINLKRKNQMIWTAVGNSLDGFTFLLPFSRGIPKGKDAAIQAAIIGTLTAARSTIEYQRLSAEGKIEEMQQLWELRKSDLNAFTALQKEALELEFKLYQKFKLNEFDRLTETTASRFNEITATKDPDTRIRRLKDNEHVYSSMADYYYHLGMAYIDLQDYKSAKPYFDKYALMYQAAPIYRHNEKIGCIALAKLAFDRNLTRQEKERLIRTALDNLPDNGAAVLQVAYICMKDFGNYEKAFNILRTGIDNTAISDRDVIIDTSISLMEEIKNYPDIYSSIQKAIDNSEDIRLANYITYIMQSDNTEKWKRLSDCLLLNPTDPAKEKLSNQVYGSIGTNVDSHFLCKDKQSAEALSKSVTNNDKLYIHINDRFVLLPEELEIYHIKQDNSNMKIVQYTQSAYGAIKKKDIYDDLEFLQNFPSVFNYFFESADNKGNYRVNGNIDYDRVSEENYSMLHPEIQRMFEFSLTESEKKELVKYCKKQIATAGMNPVIICQDKTGYFADENKSVSYREAAFSRDTVVRQLPVTDGLSKKEPLCKIDFYGDSLTVTPETWYGKKAEYLVMKIKGMKATTLTMEFVNGDCRLFSVEHDGKVRYNNFAVAHVKEYMTERNKIIAEQNDTLGIMDKAKRKWDNFFNNDKSQNQKQEEKTKKESSKGWYEFWK